MPGNLATVFVILFCLSQVSLAVISEEKFSKVGPMDSLFAMSPFQAFSKFQFYAWNQLDALWSAITWACDFVLGHLSRAIFLKVDLERKLFPLIQNIITFIK